MSDPAKDYGFHHSTGLQIGDKVMGPVDVPNAEERLIPQSGELVRGPKDHTYKIPGNAGEFHRQHGTEGGSLDATIYIDTEYAGVGYEILRAMESDATPFMLHPSQVDPTPVGVAGGQLTPTSASWCWMRGIPGLGGQHGDPHMPDLSLPLCGEEERLSEPPTAMGAITPTPATTSVAMTWDGDEELLSERNQVNINQIKYRVVGWAVYWKETANGDETYALVAQDGDIASTPAFTDWRCLPDFLSVFNTGGGTDNIAFTVTGLTASTDYTFKAVPYTHFIERMDVQTVTSLTTA